jgi:hypothetical protein
MKIRRFNENNTELVKTDFRIQQVVNYADLMVFIDKNEDYFGFSADTFHDKMVENFFDEGKLTSRYTIESCEYIINKDFPYHSKYWDNQREYMKAVLEFLKINNIDDIRFAFDD